jgi:hypothetical protein
MTKLRFILAFVFSFHLTLFTLADAATYYVDTSGSDKSNGSSSTPWKTIQKAADSVSAGDVVIVRSGTYSGRVSLNRSGSSSGGYITFRGEGSAIINGNGSKSAGITGNGVKYIRLENLEVKNWHRDGIAFDGSSSNWNEHIEIINCTVTDNGLTAANWDHGIQLNWTRNFLVSGCKCNNNYTMGLVGFYSEYGYVVDSEFISNDGTGGYSDDSDGLNFQNSSHIKIANCYASENGEEGFDFGGWEGDGSTRSTFDIHLRNCISTNNHGTGLSLSGTDGTQFETYHASMANCLFKNNRFAATFIYQGAHDIFIANNTFLNNVYGINLYSGSHDVFYKNNIVMTSSNTQFPVKPSNYNYGGAYNNWYPDVPPSDRRGTPYFSQNPNLKGDFTLKSSSPMIDLGGPLTQTTSSGSGTTVTVGEARWFTGGWSGVAPGDTIMIGSKIVMVTDLPDNQTLKVDRPISWNNNEGVSFFYAGSAPDIGWDEYGSIEPPTPPAIPTNLSANW